MRTSLRNEIRNRPIWGRRTLVVLFMMFRGFFGEIVEPQVDEMKKTAPGSLLGR